MRLIRTSCLTAALLASTAVLAAETAKPAADTAPPAQQAAAEDDDIDTESVAALKRMGDSLRKLDRFSVKVVATLEDVLDDGQKIQFIHESTIQADRPDKLRMDIMSDRKERHIYYDGKKLTVFAPKLGYFASFDAPPTIGETLKVAREKYDVELPLTDLFTWGTDGAQEEALTSAMYVGTDTIGGQSCEHYAYRQPGTDWQIWLAKGESALPCKLVIAATDDETQPQYEALLTWSPTASIDPAVFSFVPPDKSYKIAIGIVEPAAGGN